MSSSKTGVLSKLVLISIAGQILSFVANPVLASYYSPDELGVFRYYLNLSSILSLVCCLGFERAIYKADEREKIQLMLLGGAFCISLVFAIVAASLYMNNYPLMLSGTYVLFNLSYVYMISYAASVEKFNQVYLIKSYQSISSPILKVSSAFLGLSVISLFISEVISKIISFCIYMHIITKHVVVHGIDTSEYRKLVRKFKSYITKAYPGSILNAISLFFPIYFINLHFGYHEVGLYTMCVVITQTPLSMISGNISTVIQAKFRNGNDRFMDAFGKVLAITIYLFALMPIYLNVNNEYLVGVIFSDKWLEISTLIPSMAIWGFLWGISSPYASIFHLYDEESTLFKIQKLKFITRLIYLWCASYYLGFVDYVIGYVLIGGVIQVVQLCVLLKIVRFDTKAFVVANTKFAAIIFLLAAFSLVTKMMPNEVALAVSTVTIIVALFLGRNELLYIKNNV